MIISESFSVFGEGAVKAFAAKGYRVWGTMRDVDGCDAEKRAALEACSSKVSVIDMDVLTLEQGLILSLRFRSNNITARVERFQLAAGSNNGNLGWTVTLSVSEAWAELSASRPGPGWVPLRCCDQGGAS